MIVHTVKVGVGLSALANAALAAFVAVCAEPAEVAAGSSCLSRLARTKARQRSPWAAAEFTLSEVEISPT